MCKERRGLLSFGDFEPVYFETGKPALNAVEASSTADVFLRLDCAHYVLGVPSAIYSGYRSTDEARGVYNAAIADGCVFDMSMD